MSLNYDILELDERPNGEIWARIKIAESQPGDLALAGALQELERRAMQSKLSASEALNWVLTIPGLDDFFAMAREHKNRIMQ